MFRKLLLAPLALAAALVGSPATAATITLGGEVWTLGGTALTLSTAYPDLTQPQSSPCIICGANQPQQTTFGYNKFGNTGNQTDLKFFSTAVLGGVSVAPDTLGTPYTAAFLINFLNSQNAGNLGFSVAIDVNDTNKAQTLESFFFLNLTTHTVLASYSPNPLDGTPIPSANNGTGTADYTLTGFSLQALNNGISTGDQLLFYARITGANDGPDSFFLVPTITNGVPEASTWAMMIAGFLGIGGMAYRRQRRVRAVA